MPTTDLVSGGNGFAGGGVGDGQRASITASITSGASPVLTPTSATTTFSAGDVGKVIYVVYSSTSYPTNLTSPTITAFNAGTGAVTLSGTNATAATSVAMDILWGSSNSSALSAFNTWALAQVGQTVLTIPAGRFCVNSNPFVMPNRNLPDVKWIGAGAGSTIISHMVASEARLGGDIPIKQKGLADAAGNSARLLTASAGLNTITLSNPSGTDGGGATYGSRMIVGRYCLIAGFDMQSVASGLFGYPPNFYFYEWNKITGYNSGTGVVTLQNPLTQAYKSTWPHWSDGDSGHADQGGPATIWVAGADYDSTVELNDLTIDSPYNQTAILCRDVILRRVTHIGPGTYPTQCNNFTADTCVYPLSLEIDKCVNNVTFINSDLNILFFQSASPNILSVTGGTLKQSTGTPKRFTYDGIAFTGAAKLQVGAAAYGVTSFGDVRNCTGIVEFSRNSGNTGDVGAATSFYSFNAGVMRFLKTDNDGISGQANPSRFFMPGAWISFDDKYIDQVVDTYEDGTYVYIQWRNTTDWLVTPIAQLKPHPCPDFTMRNCAGTALELEDWNQAPARIPLYSYSKRTYTADGTGTTVKTAPTILGRLTTIKLTVATPGSVAFNVSRFNNWNLYKTDYTSTAIGPAIACAFGGLRTVTGAAAPSGAQGTDVLPDLTSLGQLWSTPGQYFSGPIFSANGSNAVITMEINVDQGIPSAVAANQNARVRLRVR